MIAFIYRTKKSSTERRWKVLKKMIRIEFISHRIVWVANPELESDAGRKKKKKEKFYRSVRYMSVMFVISAALFFLIGLINIKSDFLVFQIFSCIFAPINGLVAMFYIYLWYLMKKLDYQNIPSLTSNR